MFRAYTQSLADGAAASQQHVFACLSPKDQPVPYPGWGHFMDLDGTARCFPNGRECAVLLDHPNAPGGKGQRFSIAEKYVETRTGGGDSCTLLPTSEDRSAGAANGESAR